jgi:hypothetical protein
VGRRKILVVQAADQKRVQQEDAIQERDESVKEADCVAQKAAPVRFEVEAQIVLRMRRRYCESNE